MSSSRHIPISKALLWIFLSVLLVSGPALIGWLYYIPLRQLRQSDTQYRIEAIIQTTPQKEALKTVYLAELLDLAADKPSNLYQFDSNRAEQKLTHSPLIKEATIKKISPGTLYIDYTMRTPIIYLGDYVNAALDEEGILIPFTPFFTSKNMPVFYLGLTSHEKSWGDKLDDEKIELAFQVWETAKLYFDQVREIDVSNAFSESYGQRQIVLILEDQRNDGVLKKVLLRLNTRDYQQNLEDYITLDCHLRELGQETSNTITVDFRIPQLAFIGRM